MGNGTINAIDLDAGQEYTLDWVVEDHSVSPPTIMMQNDHIWVAGNDGTYTYELEFHDLAIRQTLALPLRSQEVTKLQVVDNVCWPSASTADGDGDGVYDKNDFVRIQQQDSRWMFRFRQRWVRYRFGKRLQQSKRCFEFPNGS